MEHSISELRAISLKEWNNIKMDISRDLPKNTISILWFTTKYSNNSMKLLSEKKHSNDSPEKRKLRLLKVKILSGKISLIQYKSWILRKLRMTENLINISQGNAQKTHQSHLRMSPTQRN